MEKVERMEKKSNRFIEILSNKKVKYVIGTILLSGIGVALPRIFHVLAGANAGAIFLPMHIAVLIAALTLGAISGSVVAGSSVIFSYLLTGMPSLARLPYMLIELVIYAIVLSLLNKKFNDYVSLILTIVLGRILYAGFLLVAVDLLGFPSYGISVIESVQTGILGIIIQLIFVPIISKVVKKGIQLND